MTRSKKLRVLREIYATIPSPGCKGLCVDACSTIPVLPIELEQLEVAVGRKLPTFPMPENANVRLLGTEIGARCSLLALGRCTAYEHRPLICRAFGSVEGMRCPHGCRPDELIKDAEMYGKFERIAGL